MKAPRSKGPKIDHDRIMKEDNFKNHLKKL